MTGLRNASRRAARLRGKGEAMTTKTKGRAGGHQATPNTSTSTCNFTGIVSRLKATIVTLAVWGIVPMRLASWLIQRGGLRHE